MNKNSCSVVQDLTPLVLDRVASDESRSMVEEHIALCAQCRMRYEAMKAEMPEAIRKEYEEDQQQFKRAAMDVRKQRMKRKILSLALAAILCLTAAFGGMFAYDRLFRQMSVVVENHLYRLSLSRLQDGRVVVTAAGKGIDFNVMTAAEECQTEEGHNMYFYLASAPIRVTDRSSNGKRKWCMSVLDGESLDSLDEIGQGKGQEYQKIWARGEAIPAASPQMEAYFALEDKMNAWMEQWESANEGGIISQEEMIGLHHQLEQARLKVPEWK